MANWEDDEDASAEMCDHEALISPGDGDAPERPGAQGARWKKVSAVATAAALGAVLLLGRGRSSAAPERMDAGAVVGLQEADDPNWGCGLVGALPGIHEDGTATPAMQEFIDAVKSSSSASINKVSYWNWNWAPESTDKGSQFLTEDFVFMPENWGAGVANDKFVRQAGTTGWEVSNGKVSKAQMSYLLLGMNEPDITGSCMGNMFGQCKRPCTDTEVQAHDCPAAHLKPLHPVAHPNAGGGCNCWQYSHATGVGFWSLHGCSGTQPLPTLFGKDKIADPNCVTTVMENWRKTAQIAVAKGYKYLTTPLVAEDISYAEDFIKEACQCSSPGVCACTDASCGCPVYVGFHFYAYDCRPESAGGYKGFRKRLNEVTELMEKYTFVKGAIINEVGMLNCKPHEEDPICKPDSGQFPASDSPDHSCPFNDQLPNGLSTFIDKLFDIIIDQKTSSGKAVVKGFSWFNEDQAGGTYNLQLFNADGTPNDVGKSYMRNCKKWGENYKGVSSAGSSWPFGSYR